MGRGLALALLALLGPQPLALGGVASPVDAPRTWPHTRSAERARTGTSAASREQPGVNELPVRAPDGDDRIDWQMRPPPADIRARMVAARFARFRERTTRFDLLPQVSEQADPRWHRPSAGTELRDGSPTTVYWVVTPRLSHTTLFALNMSLVAAVRTRAQHGALRLLVVVFGANASSAPPIDLCAALVPAWRRERLAPNSLATGSGHNVCREMASTRVDESCEPPPSPHPARPARDGGVTLTLVRATGEWLRHARLLSILSSWTAFKRAPGKSKGRIDLVEVAPTLIFRWFASQLLLHAGVTRAIYLDADTCAMRELSPLFRLPLSARYPLGLVRRQRHDRVYTRERYNLSEPLGLRYGFYSDDAQATNAGVFVLDCAHMCKAGHLRLLDQLAREIVERGNTLFGKNAGFDQPLAIVAFAANTTYADPRWNCRRPWTAFARCHVLHTRNCAAGVASGLPDAQWLTDQQFFQRPP